MKLTPTVFASGAGRAVRRVTVLGATAALLLTLSPAVPPGAAAQDRCTPDAGGNWSCTHSSRINWYSCNGWPTPRRVRWQVPDGTPPPGGWPVAFYYAGTQPTDTKHAFSRDVGDSFGQEYEPQVIHELLDDPAGSGTRYAVFVPDPPASGGWLQFWHTNTVNPYSASCDYDFFPDFWGEIAGGSYGSASQYNLSRRFAYGISSGGFNTSRMAVTFNGGNVWKALGIISASYATCSSSCSVPTLPSNHPPTRFWHGVNDSLVPISTMRAYHDKLIAGGFTAEKLEHAGGHELTADLLGPTGMKAWFDRF